MKKERIRKLKKEMKRELTALSRVSDRFLSDCQTEEEKAVFSNIFKQQKADIVSKYKALQAEPA